MTWQMAWPSLRSSLRATRTPATIRSRQTRTTSARASRGSTASSSRADSAKRSAPSASAKRSAPSAAARAVASPRHRPARHGHHPLRGAERAKKRVLLRDEATIFRRVGEDAPDVFVPGVSSSDPAFSRRLRPTLVRPSSSSRRDTPSPSAASFAFESSKTIGVLAASSSARCSAARAFARRRPPRVDDHTTAPGRARPLASGGMIAIPATSSPSRPEVVGTRVPAESARTPSPSSANSYPTTPPPDAPPAKTDPRLDHLDDEPGWTSRWISRAPTTLSPTTPSISVARGRVPRHPAVGTTRNHAGAAVEPCRHVAAGVAGRRRSRSATVSSHANANAYSDARARTSFARASSSSSSRRTRCRGDARSSPHQTAATGDHGGGGGPRHRAPRSPRRVARPMTSPAPRPRARKSTRRTSRGVADKATRGCAAYAHPDHPSPSPSPGRSPWRAPRPRRRRRPRDATRRSRTPPTSRAHRVD